MTGCVALSWKSGERAIEKLDRLRSTMAVNVLILKKNYIKCVAQSDSDLEKKGLFDFNLNMLLYIIRHIYITGT